MDTKNPLPMSDAVSTGIRGLLVQTPQSAQEPEFEDTTPLPTVESLQEDLREVWLEIAALRKEFLTWRSVRGRA